MMNEKRNTGDDEHFAHWCLRNTGKVFGVLVLTFGVGGSFAVAQYQLSVLNSQLSIVVDRIESRIDYLDKHGTQGMRMSAAARQESDRRIDRLETQFEVLRAGQSAMQADLSYVRATLEDWKRQELKKPGGM